MRTGALVGLPACAALGPLAVMSCRNSRTVSPAADPDHPLRYQSGGNNLDHPADPILNFRFNTLQPQTHYGFTGGWGIALKNRVQIDSAVSAGDDATEVVVSMVIRVR